MPFPSRSFRAAAPLGWALVLLVAARLPGAVRLFPALALFRGALGLGLLALAFLVVLARVRGDWIRIPSGWIGGQGTAWACFATAAALYLAVGLFYTSRLRVSGDEPHYLLMAQSLWREHDLDLRDNFERGDFLEYTPGPLAPHYGAPRVDGRPYPAHSPGLPLLFAPLYALGGRAACVAALALAAALLTVEIRALALRATDGHEVAGGLAWVAALGPPVFFYSFHLYTEVPSALAIVLALRVLTAVPAAGPLRAIGAAFAAAVLPWLHVKLIPAAVALGLLALWRWRGRSRIAFALTAGAMAVGYLLYYRHVFGLASPLALYGGALPPDLRGSPARAALGLLLDRSFGLLPCAPVFLLSLAGLFSWRRAGTQAVAHLAVAAAVLAPILAWRMWWGGQCPPGRFLVPLVPFLAVTAARRVASGEGRGLARWKWALAAIGMAIAVYAASRPGALLLLNRGDRPTRLWTALADGAPAGRYLPSLVFGPAEELRVALLWVVVVVGLLVLDRLARRNERVDRWFGGLGLPVLMLLAVGIGVDGWARKGSPIDPWERQRPAMEAGR